MSPLRHWTRAAAVAVPLALAAPPAQAGLGSLLKAAAKLGRAGKVGAKGGSLAKGGAALKGASLLGAGAAAERVFLHAADDVGRVGVFVADAGDDAVKVVLRGGEEASHSVDSMRGLVRDLDEMARLSPDAGVDVFLDPNALRHLDDLPAGENTRLFLANTDGPSWPVRRAEGGVAHVGVGPGDGAGGRAWLRMGPSVADLGLELALRLSSAPVVTGATRSAAVDADCGEATSPPVAATAAEALQASQPGDTVVLFAESPEQHAADAAELAERHGIDLVILGLAEVCPAGQPAPPSLTAVLQRVLATQTLGELWAVGTTEAAPRVFDEARQLGDRLVLTGPGVVAVHAVADVGDAVAGDDDELPEWVKAILGGCILLGFLAVKGWWAARRDEGDAAD